MQVSFSRPARVCRMSISNVVIEGRIMYVKKILHKRGFVMKTKKYRYFY